MNAFRENMGRAARVLAAARLGVALTGAGISVESGIPDFRSAGGLWARYPVEAYGTLKAFRDDPKKVWQMLAEMGEVISGAKPNGAHIGLARLEKMGILRGIITQNIDNLHQDGGAERVIEYHGNASRFTCLSCGREYGAREMGMPIPPECPCGQILKPKIIFFGETLPFQALHEAHELVSSCDALLVIGTSARVSPASAIPSLAKRAGATIIEINIEKTVLTHRVSDLFLKGKAGEVVPELVDQVEKTIKRGSGKGVS